MNIEKWAIGILTVVIAVLLGIAIFSAENRDSYPIRGDENTESRGGDMGSGRGGAPIKFDRARDFDYATLDVVKAKKKSEEGGRSIVLDDEGGGSSSAPATQRTTLVKKNETFSHIAKRVWNKASLYPLLVKANPQLNPRNLRRGQTVKIPALPGESKVKELRSAGASAATSQTPRNSPRMHTVASNENLSKISKRYYRTASKWKQIFEANRDQLKSPDAVVAGQVLRIP